MTCQVGHEIISVHENSLLAGIFTGQGLQEGYYTTGV
jgi:hypothetical protein